MERHSRGTKNRVSILVPIFNVQDYLRECLDSLVQQTLKEIEIICINDGSTDDSLKIIEEYAQKDKRIKIINKNNTGYGDSMNKGLAEAKGEYIGIVEPDDFIELDAFKKMYEKAKENKVEIVKANFYEYKTKSKHDTNKSNLFLMDEIEKVIDPREHRHIFFQQPSIWSAIYEKNFLQKNQIGFLPSSGASYQDAGFNFKVFAMARKVLYLNEGFLHYRCDNPKSSVKSEGKVYAVKNEYDEVEDFLRKNGLINEYGRTLAVVRMSSYIWNMRRLTKKAALEFAQEIKKDYKKYKKNGYFEIDETDKDKDKDKDVEFIINNIAIRNPEKYIKLRFWYELKNASKTKLLKMYKRITKRNEVKKWQNMTIL